MDPSVSLVDRAQNAMSTIRVLVLATMLWAAAGAAVSDEGATAGDAVSDEGGAAGAGVSDEEFAALLAHVVSLEGRLASTEILGHELTHAKKTLTDLEKAIEDVLQPMDASWVITSATMVFLMQLGFAQLEAGLVRPKNVVATYMKNIIDFVLGAMSALFFGYAIAYGDWPLRMNMEAWKFFFHLVFQATASTIVSGAIAGRIRLDAYMILTMAASGIVFSLSVRWTWGGGWLSTFEYPFHDFAGSAVVHMLGGAAAGSTTVILGPRIGRFDPEHEFEFEPHSVPQVLSGILLLWVGWYGFNPGSTGAMSSIEDARVASNAAMTTTISGSVAGCAMFAFMLYRTNFGTVDVLHFGNSVLAGLVGITAGCDTITAFGSLWVGMGSAFVYYQAYNLMHRLQIDDVVAATPVHGAAGAFGTIAVGFLDPTDGLFYSGNGWLLVTQCYGVLAIAALGSASLGLLALMLDRLDMLRTDPEEEDVGLDLYVFGIQAYKEEKISEEVEDQSILYKRRAKALLASDTVLDRSTTTLLDSYRPPLSPSSLDATLTTHFSASRDASPVLPPRLSRGDPRAASPSRMSRMSRGDPSDAAPPPAALPSPARLPAPSKLRKPRRWVDRMGIIILNGSAAVVAAAILLIILSLTKSLTPLLYNCAVIIAAAGVLAVIVGTCAMCHAPSPMAVFRKFDEDTSGDIDVLELKNALRSLGMEVDDASLAQIFNKYDTDGSHKLDRAEFRRLVQEVRSFHAARGGGV